MFTYALIREDGTVYGTSSHPNTINNKNAILVSEDFNITNKKYVNGEWVEYTPEPLPEPEPTQLDIIQEMVAKSNEKLRQEGYDNCVMDFIKDGAI